MNRMDTTGYSEDAYLPCVTKLGQAQKYNRERFMIINKKVSKENRIQYGLQEISDDIHEMLDDLIQKNAVSHEQCKYIYLAVLMANRRVFSRVMKNRRNIGLSKKDCLIILVFELKINRMLKG